MAFNLENMTVDYKKLFRMVPTDRATLAQSGAINDLLGALTPGQLVSLFPRYYRDQLPDVGLSGTSVSSTARLAGAMSGAGGYKPSGGGTYAPTTSPGLKKTLTPEEKAVQELMAKAGISYGTGDVQLNKQYLLDAMNKGGVEDPKIRAAMMAVVKGETQFLTRSEDSYEGTSAGRIREVFARTHRFDGMSDAQIDELKKNPEAFFNHVYGGRIGNATNEGYKYRGRGFFQLTGKANYEKYGNMIGVDLVSNPDLANDPQIAAKIAVEYIKDRYTAAPGVSEREKVFRAVGASVPGTEEVKNAAYNEYLQTGEFAPGKVADIESAIARTQQLDNLPPFDPSMITQLDERLQKWYEKAEGMQKRNFELALQKLGTEQFNETMKKQPVNNTTLQSVVTEGSRVSEEQAGFRSSPLKPELRNALEYAAEQSGLYVKVFSGGQTEEQQAALAASQAAKGKRGPSDRHDIENPETPGAADIKLAYRDSSGREVILDQSNPEHWPMIAEFVKNSSRTIESAGVGGWSPNDNYMGRDSLHIGGPNKKGDAPLAYQGMEYLKQAHAEGVALREQDKENNYDPLAEWIKKKQEERSTVPDPVTAAQSQLPQQSPPTRETLEPVQIPEPGTPSLPVTTSAAGAIPEPRFSFATGGEIVPGEDIAGVNMNTGDVEFMANSREKIRIDPAELENTQQMPVITQEDTKRLETPNQPLQRPTVRSEYRENSDPNLYNTMAEGYTPVPPSALRATNRAKLYGEVSSDLVNGHFS